MNCPVDWKLRCAAGTQRKLLAVQPTRQQLLLLWAVAVGALMHFLGSLRGVHDDPPRRAAAAGSGRDERANSLGTVDRDAATIDESTAVPSRGRLAPMPAASRCRRDQPPPPRRLTAELRAHDLAAPSNRRTTRCARRRGLVPYRT